MTARDAGEVARGMTPGAIARRATEKFLNDQLAEVRHKIVVLKARLDGLEFAASAVRAHLEKPDE